MITIDGSLGDLTVQVDLEDEQLEFVLAQDDFGAVMRSYQWAMEQGFWASGRNGKRIQKPQEKEQGVDESKDDSEEEVVKASQGAFMFGTAVSHYQVISRIKGWNGIHLSSGQPAPCTEENKLLFFGKYPGVLSIIIRELDLKEEAERKNSEASQAG